MAQKHRARHWHRKKKPTIYINANIYSAWGPWSKEMDRASSEIQALHLQLISPLYLWILAKGLWTGSTVGWNETLNRSIIIHRLLKHQQNLEGSLQGRVQTIKSHISSSIFSSSSPFASLPPAGNSRAGKIFFGAARNMLRPHTHTVHRLLLTTSSWELPMAIRTKNTTESPLTTQSVPACLWPLQYSR